MLEKISDVMGKEQRIKISQDRTRICKYCAGDLVVDSFNKYGKHTFISEVGEVTAFFVFSYYLKALRS